MQKELSTGVVAAIIGIVVVVIIGVAYYMFGRTATVEKHAATLQQVQQAGRIPGMGMPPNMRQPPPVQLGR